MKRQHILLPAIVISLLLLQLTFAASPRYEIIDLGTLGGNWSAASSINNGGWIVGCAEDSSGYRRATLFDPTGKSNNIDLAALGGNPGRAFSVNDTGQIVGDAHNNLDHRLATLFDPTGSGNNIDLGTLGGHGSSAYSINDGGQIAGWAENSSGDWHATLFGPTGNGNNIDLGTLGGNISWVYSTNDSGQIVGFANNSSGNWRATLFDPTGSGNNIDLGTLAGRSSGAHSVNNNGQIVGWARNSSDNMHATLFDPSGGGNNVDLGTLGGDYSEAHSIDDSGQIVGTAANSSGNWRATLFDPTGSGNNIDLNTLIDPASGWTLIYAPSINKHGWIVGQGINPDGEYHAYPLIPEPIIIYVDDGATGANDGSSWADAFNYLQDALSVAYSGDEIWVAQGTYKPDQGAGITQGNREATFQLINGVTIKGGYAGFGELDPNARDIQLYETILTGDLNGDDVEVANPEDLLEEPTRADNSYHIVLSSAAGPNTVLEGFTIMDGKAVGSYPGNEGAGMYNEGGSPTIVNCTFYRNSAEGCGGGICDRNSSPTLTNCWFEFNAAGNQGGGMVSVGGSHSSEPRVCNPRLTNCIFRNNSAGYRGGGMLITLSNAMLVNCAFIANSAESTGGAFVNFHRSPTLVNCIILGNTARHCGGLMSYSPGATLVNCILWSNHDSSGQEQSAQISHEYLHTKVVVNYSCIRGWTGTLGGTGNIGADPLFAQPGYWDANGAWIDGDYHLLPTSPCIDAGDPNHPFDPNETDLDGKPRIIGGRIDMGAFEYRPPVPAEVRIVPRTINLTSKGKWITCHISLPEDYNVADIDPNSVLLEDEIEAESVQVDEQQQVAIARFIRSKVQSILKMGEVELTITGQLTNGTVFEGTDVIRVLNKAGKK